METRRAQGRCHIPAPRARHEPDQTRIPASAHRRQRRRFGAQHARAELHRLKAGGKSLLLFCCRPTAFGADHKRNVARRGGRFLQALRMVQAQQQPRIGRRQIRQRFAVALQRPHLRHHVAPALLAGRHHDFLPARHPFVGTLAGQPHNAALAQHRPNFGHAQFHAFLQGEIHALAAGHRLYQRDAQRRFIGRCRFIQHQSRRAPLFQRREPGGISAAVAVEQSDFFARLHPQHMQMAQHIIGQFKHKAGA